MFDIFSVKEKLQAMLNTDKDFTDEDIEKVLIFHVLINFLPFTSLLFAVAHVHVIGLIINLKLLLIIIVKRRRLEALL